MRAPDGEAQGEHFVFLIDNNGFINGQSVHTLHTVRHWQEFCRRAKKSVTLKQKKKEKSLAESLPLSSNRL